MINSFVIYIHYYIFTYMYKDDKWMLLLFIQSINQEKDIRNVITIIILITRRKKWKIFFSPWTVVKVFHDHYQDKGQVFFDCFVCICILYIYSYDWWHKIIIIITGMIWKKMIMIMNIRILFFPLFHLWINEIHHYQLKLKKEKNII